MFSFVRIKKTKQNKFKTFFLFEKSNPQKKIMTNFTFLSRYDTQGFMDICNQDENKNNISESVSQEFLDEMNSNLPGGQTVVDVHPDWIQKSDIETVESCEIKLTFLGEGAGYKNALGYFIYDLDSPPGRITDTTEIFVVFPNASQTGSGGSMSPGDTIKLAYEATGIEEYKGERVATALNYVFPPNKGISFVIHADKWKNNGSSNAYLAYGHSMYTSNPWLNPESQEDLKHHFVNYKSNVDPSKIVYGAEDIHREKSWCDHDFNDLTFYVTPTPFTAISTASYNATSKQEFTGTILCEDLLNRPNADLDYDDLCLEYEILEELAIDGKLTSLSFKMKTLHRGATLDHTFGVVVPKIKNIASAKIFREKFITATGETAITHMTSDIVGKGTDKIPIIDSTTDFLPPEGSWSTNTQASDVAVPPSYVRLRIVFPNGGIDRSEINNARFPFTFYLDVFRDPNDIMWTLFSDVDYTDVTAEAIAKGVTSKKKIILLEGFSNFRVPLEKQPLRKVYFKFLKYLAGDKRFKSWYAGKWTKKHLLAPAVIHEDTHGWHDAFLKRVDVDNTTLLPLSTNQTWSVEALVSPAVNTSDVFDWDTIDDSSSESLITLLKDFERIHVIRSGNFVSNNGDFYSVVLSSNTSAVSSAVNSTQYNGGSESITLLEDSTTLGKHFSIIS